ncbi:MAG: shikimate kinase [Acidimicrobiia bacterium]|nr:shikimate kinase [Acidimicrobiia bacterium]
MTSKLWLIGMMSSGKTKVGRRLTELSGFPLVDTDDQIVDRAGLTIPEIFATHGEPAFRAMESEEVARIARRADRLVVATGGGAILDRVNRSLMRDTGLVVWLKPSIGSLIAKGKTKNRPLLLGHDDLAARYTEIWEARKHLYQEASHMAISMDGKTRKEVAEEVWSLWQRR